MIEVRSFEGTTDDLAEFTNRVWRETYRGRMPTPIWSAQHFARDLVDDDEDDRYLLVAAYDGTQLVGSHPARKLTVNLHGEPCVATWGSFLSVDPAYRKQGVAFRLQAESLKRHRERALPMSLGFAYVRSPHSVGPEFWRLQGARMIAEIGTWARPLDHAAIAEFEIYPFESRAARLLGHVQREPQPPTDTTGIREYAPGDLGDCVALLNDAGAGSDLAYVWGAREAARQLSYANLSKTLVLERDGRVVGLVNYTLLDVFGRTEARIARIDAVALGTLDHRDGTRLLKAATASMHDDGAKGATALRGSWTHWRELVAAGFMPTPTEFYYVALPTRDDVPLSGVRRLNVVWR
jgi:GNAT superfamily N-acetyltransferase